MSRRLVAGLVALVALGGVFVFGLTKQDDVSRIDTANVIVPPEGFQTFAAAAITGTSFDGAHVLARAAAGQARVHQLLGLVVRAVQARGARPARLQRALGGRAAFVGVAYESPHATPSRSRARRAGAIRS